MVVVVRKGVGVHVVVVTAVVAVAVCVGVGAVAAQGDLSVKHHPACFAGGEVTVSDHQPLDLVYR